MRYPIEQLPDIIKDAILSYQEYGQQPTALLANSALSNVSLACQGITNVARDESLISPISMYFITVASSGERKSAADKVFGEAIDTWQHLTKEMLRPEYEESIIDFNMWKAKERSILGQIKRATNKDEDTEILESKYKDIVYKRPDIPLLPNLKYEDITTEALANNLANEYPSGSIWSDEAGIFLSNPAMQRDNMKFVSLLNRLWDGKSIIINRKTSADLHIHHRRFTLNLMMQPVMLDHLINKKNEINRNSGFLARTLIAYPESTMGNRFYKESIGTTPEMVKFNNRLQEILEKSNPSLENGFKNIPTLRMSTNAKKTWISHFNDIEKAMDNDFHWRPIHDIASKASENIVRLAALFHIFTKQEGDISEDNINRAFKIIEWYLNHTLSVFNHDLQINKIQKDAKIIEDWIKYNKLQSFTARDILKKTSVKTKERRDKALSLLKNKNLLHMTKEGKSTIILVRC